MRGSLGASDTAFARGFLAATAAVILAGCAHAAPRHPPDRQPPPHILVVGLDQVALRTSAWPELHAWLAAEARERARSEIVAVSEAEAARRDPEIDAAVLGYAKALASDDRDELLGRTARALAACENERCARAAAAGSPFAAPYLAALPGFLARHWAARAANARAATERARAALGAEPEVEALVSKVARDLAIDWPSPPPVVDLIGVAPPPGPEAPIRVLLSVDSSCFARSRGEREQVRDARIVDCVLAYAAIGLAPRSALATALSRELTARGMQGDFERAWTALVVHAVATTVTGWEPNHVSVLRKSVSSVMPEAMRWLAEEWPSRMRGASADDIAKPYAAALADARKAVARPAP